MREHFVRDQEAERLLLEMASRVQATPALAEEWRDARRAWPDAGADPRSQARFLEWFLLERISPALGGPPAAVWSPTATGEEHEDPWTRLLASFYGIFRSSGDGHAGAPLLDLWSGRELRLEPADALPANALLFARAVPQGEGRHAVLPGWRIAASDALTEALIADLAAARVKAPRARLSQAELERLWSAGRSTATPAPPRAFPALLRELADLLVDVPNWDVDRALEILEAEGAEPLLEQLAFETQVPLEPVRLWLAELRAAAEADEAARPAARPEPSVDPETTAAALEAFDQERAAGGDFRTAWARLMESLQVEDESDEATEPWRRRGTDPIGPTELPGLGFWVDAWAWECEQIGRAPTVTEMKTARAFARFVESLRAEAADAAEVGAADLWAFFAGASEPAALEERRAGLLPFLRWLRDEQGATLPLEEAADPGSPEWRRLAASVAINARLRTVAGAPLQAARIWKTAPLRVRTEDAEEAPVLGLPPEAEALARIGDALTGRWEAGRFRAAGWYPGDFAAAGNRAEPAE